MTKHTSAKTAAVSYHFVSHSLFLVTQTGVFTDLLSQNVVERSGKNKNSGRFDDRERKGVVFFF